MEDKEIEEIKDKCCECGKEEGELIKQDNELYCKDCHTEKFNYCEDCEKYFEGNENEVNGNRNVCDNCFENYTQCEDCNKYHRDDDINNGRCDDCNENYTTCDNCPAIIHHDNEYYHENSDDRLCENCYNERISEEENSTIYPYSYKPDAEFFKEENESKIDYLGIELEIECEENLNENAEAVLAIDNDKIYLKEDGSLSRGFEIVSHPMSLNFHKKFAWEKILQTLQNNNCKSHSTSTCGLHIHLAKKFFTQTEQIKIAGFIYSNKIEFDIIARRSMNNYAKFIKKPETGCEKLNCMKNEDRYTAVNFLNNHTIEFRMFKGTLNYKTFMASLELVDAIGKWIKSTNIHQVFSTEGFSLFLDYLKKSEYEFLKEYLLLLASKSKFSIDRNAEIIKKFPVKKLEKKEK